MTISKVLTRQLLTICTLIVPAIANGTDIDPTALREMTPKAVTVLENRQFQKTFRPEMGLIFGSMINEAYTNTKTYGIRAGIFIEEWLGFEGQYLSTSISNTDDRDALTKLQYRDVQDPDEFVSPDPVVNPILSIKDITVIAAPFYGKVNLMDKAIIYSDLYLTTGLSSVTTEQGDHISLSFGIGQRFYFSKSWSFRADFKNRIYSEKRNGKDSSKNAYSFDLGASFFFM